MFGIGLPEMAVVALVAILVFGPDRIPELAKQAGQMVRKMRNLANNARDELRGELGSEFDNLDWRDLNPREFVRRQIREAMEEIDAEEAAAKAAPKLADGELPPFDGDAT
jgi:sec-independent protein translocase protein TatB